MAIYERRTPEGILRESVRAMAAQGATIEEISRQLGVGTFWVQRVISDSNINATIAYHLRNIWDACSQVMRWHASFSEQVTSIEASSRLILEQQEKILKRLGEIEGALRQIIPVEAPEAPVDLGGGFQETPGRSQQ